MVRVITEYRMVATRRRRAAEADPPEESAQDDTARQLEQLNQSLQQFMQGVQATMQVMHGDIQRLIDRPAAAAGGKRKGKELVTEDDEPHRDHQRQRRDIVIPESDFRQRPRESPPRTDDSVGSQPDSDEVPPEGGERDESFPCRDRSHRAYRDHREREPTVVDSDMFHRGSLGYYPSTRGVHQSDPGAAFEANLSMFERVQRLRPPRFDGTTGPERAEQWLQEIDKLFHQLGMESTQRVLRATYNLSGRAENWWRSESLAFEQEQARRPRDQRRATMDWGEFQGRFRGHFISEAVRAQRRREFESLVQGSLTVEAYEQRFTSLIRYAPHYEYDEAVKTERFLEGLRPQIRPYLRASRIKSFHDLVQTAMRLEMEPGLSAPQFRHDSSSRPHIGGQGNFRGDFRFRQSRGARGRGGVPIGQSNRGIPVCVRCGRLHPGRPCHADAQGCFRCGCLDHQVSRCPYPRQPYQRGRPQFRRRSQYRTRDGHRGSGPAGLRPVLAPVPLRVVAPEQDGPSGQVVLVDQQHQY